MRTWVLLMAVIAIGYFSYQNLRDTATIATPVFAEMRTGIAVEGKSFDLLVLGKMNSASECRERAQSVWQTVMGECAQCKVEVLACRDRLEPRHQRLFDNQPIETTYLTLTGENDGRVLIYGATLEQSNQLCPALSAELAKRYRGKVSCVIGVAE